MGADRPPISGRGRKNLGDRAFSAILACAIKPAPAQGTRACLQENSASRPSWPSVFPSPRAGNPPRWRADRSQRRRLPNASKVEPVRRDVTRKPSDLPRDRFLTRRTRPEVQLRGYSGCPIPPDANRKIRRSADGVVRRRGRSGPRISSRSAWSGSARRRRMEKFYARPRRDSQAASAGLRAWLQHPLRRGGVPAGADRP